MNIFVLNTDPILAAQMQCDKHVVKMCLETAQILCSVFELQNHKSPYKLTHKNHPSCVWTRTSSANYDWLIKHGKALCKEYTKRYSKKHSCEDVIEWCSEFKSFLNFPISEMTDFLPAISKESKCRQRFVNFDKFGVDTQYQLYYLCDKPFAKWKQGEPQWFTNIKEKYKIL